MPDTPEEVNLTGELEKLANIATDMQLDAKMRAQAIKVLGDMCTHDSLLVLLQLAANDKNPIEDRDLALKKAREIVKKGY